MDDLVRRVGKAELDASTAHNRAHLADPLSDHHCYLWICLCAGCSRETRVDGRFAFCDQPRRQLGFHPYPVLDAKPALGIGGRRDCLGTIIWAAIAVWPHYRWIAVAQLPYFVWVSIASVLQLSITWMNWGR